MQVQRLTVIDAYLNYKCTGMRSKKNTCSSTQKKYHNNAASSHYIWTIPDFLYTNNDEATNDEMESQIYHGKAFCEP